MVVYSLNLCPWETGQPSLNNETLCKNKKPSIAVYKPFLVPALSRQKRADL